MKTLRVLIPDAWPDVPEASWALLEEDGRIATEGLSEPRHWPASERVEAILTGSQLSWHTVRMPRASIREQTKSLPFAVEEHLVREPDSQHSTPTHQGEEAWSVLVVARDRLRRLCAQFKTLRRPLDGVFAAMQTLPWEAGHWSIALEGTGLLIRSGEHSGFCDDVISPDIPPSLLSEALDQAQAAGSLPQALLLVAAQRASAPWAAQLKLAVENKGEWAWYALPSTAANLLHGEFASRHRTDAWLKHLKPAAIALLCIFLADLLLGGVEVGLRRNELSNIRADMTRLFKSQLPGTSVLEPALQMRRELNSQRLQHGQFADDAPMVLLAALSSALGAEAANSLQSLNFETGTLNIVLANNSIDLNGLIQRLASHGVTAKRREGEALQLSLRRSES